MRNLVKIYSTIDQPTVRAGLSWYNEANQYCRQLGNTFGLELSAVCGIVSALSPGTNYEQNKKDAYHLIKGSPMHKCTTYKANVSKAKSILRGELLPSEAFNLKTGAKTYNFYQNLLNPGNPEYVTIDRHAYAIAMPGDYKGLHLAAYTRVANGYKMAANRIDILPCQLQAILWIDYRNKQNISFNTFAIVNTPS